MELRAETGLLEGRYFTKNHQNRCFVAFEPVFECLSWGGGNADSDRAVCHQLDYGDVCHRFTAFRKLFTVFAHTAAVAYPREDSLDHPSPRQHVKAFQFGAGV